MSPYTVAVLKDNKRLWVNYTGKLYPLKTVCTVQIRERERQRQKETEGDSSSMNLLERIRPIPGPIEWCVQNAIRMVSLPKQKRIDQRRDQQKKWTSKGFWKPAGCVSLGEGSSVAQRYLEAERFSNTEPLM